MIVCRDLRLLYVQVPQTGGTAVAEELCRNYGGEQLLRKHAVLEQAGAALGSSLSLYTVMAGVRHPADQAVSTFVRMQRKEVPGKGGYSNRWLRTSSAIERDHFAKQAGMTFSEYFLRFFHWIHAPKWLQSQRKADIILRFESLGEDFQQAMRDVGVVPVRPLPRVNQTPRGDAGYETYYTPPAQVRARRIFSPFMSEWSYRFPPEWVPELSRAEMRMRTLVYYGIPLAKTGRRRLHRSGRALHKLHSVSSLF